MGYDTSNYGSQTVIAAEGARVAFIICKRCGAVLLIDPRDQPKLDPIVIHDEWHDRIAALEEHANSFRMHVHDTGDY